MGNFESYKPGNCMRYCEIENINLKWIWNKWAPVKSENQDMKANLAS